ncbi:MAG: hypothetical protein KA976_08740 [Paludibacteraceae bacterium]|nr:hypothetical protein [Paludibacteraceae bacterium]
MNKFRNYFSFLMTKIQNFLNFGMATIKSPFEIVAGLIGLSTFNLDNYM